MLLNGYSVRIIGGKPEHAGYVEMQHGKNYSIMLRNNNHRKCDAAVYIDGKHVGIWRIDAFDNIRLDRPAHDDGKFTFYVKGTLSGKESGLDDVDSSDLGLIQVVFTPEKEKDWSIYYSGTVYRKSSFSTPTRGTATSAFFSDSSTADTTRTAPLTTQNSSAPEKYISGGTGLSGKSDQIFGNAHSIEYDYSGQTTINLRLVASNGGPRPLTQFSTPIPPAV